MAPYRLKDLDIDVPCGRCPECKARRVSSWSFRLMQQERVSSAAHFITLTYDTKFVPITTGCHYMSLNKSDVQLFYKRLRKRVSSHSPDVRIKYYLAGEYGGKTNRPHYHAIIFNVADWRDIERSWQLGAVHYGDVTGASIGYCLKYINKPRRVPMHRNDDRVPEFSLMSKGLGLNYLTPEMILWHRADLKSRMYLNLEGGKKCSMPRYYKDKIYDEHERSIIAAAMRAKILEQEAAVIAKLGLAEYDRRKEEYFHFAMSKFNTNFKKDKL